MLKIVMCNLINSILNIHYHQPYYTTIEHYLSDTEMWSLGYLGFMIAPVAKSIPMIDPMHWYLWAQGRGRIVFGINRIFSIHTYIKESML